MMMMAFELMLFGLGGVFLTLILFFFMIKGLRAATEIKLFKKK